MSNFSLHQQTGQRCLTRVVINMSKIRKEYFTKPRYVMAPGLCNHQTMFTGRDFLVDYFSGDSVTVVLQGLVRRGICNQRFRVIFIHYNNPDDSCIKHAIIGTLAFADG